ncbi:hypothetical protein AcV5_002054 [Taiwanofungus camphoratus]|nr:hypothetical protein AcV5_002054 [Antrodia cinnamomea]
MESSRIRSQRGKTCSDANRANAGISDEGSSSAPISTSQQGAPLESVALLEVSANRWQLNSLGKKPQQVDTGAPEVVDRKVRALLNTLTMERFDSISDQIIAWANKSEKEKGRRTLIQVIRLVFEKATDEATWSEMYARLCRKMTEQISSKVQDDGIKSAEGKPIAGGQLFRKYLLNRCQKDFKRGWVAKEVTAAAAAATKVSEDQAVKAAAEKNNTAEESVFLDEYYAAQKAKRQGLGLIKFIGELFKLQMLTERIMHECVKKLLGNVENPEEEEIESLCKLLTTVGRLLDTQKARAHMDVYFSRMRGLAKNPNVNSCVHVMLQDVIELRERNWVPYDAVATSTTIAAVHEAAAKEKAAHEKAAHQRTLSMSRGGFKRGGERGDHSQVGPNGWAVAGSAPRPPPKAGDLSNFGKISKTTSMIFGPTSVFTSKDKSKSRESTITRAGSQNMFSKLMENPELASEAATSKSSRPPSRKPSVDLGGTGLPEATPQRRKLNLLPRSKPLQTEEGKADSTPAASEANSDDEDSHVPSMSEEEAKTRIDEDLKEFFSIRDLDEAEIYFSKLPSEHKWRLVDKLVMSALESKEADAQLVADFFSRAASNNLCSPDSFEAGFMPAAETLDDVAIDAPKAFNLMATMMKGARLDEERRVRLARKWMVRPPLSSLRPPQELGTPPFYSKGTIQAASPFNRNDADMILRSSDEVDFRTHRVIISFTSDSLFTTPGFVNTPMDDQDGLAVFTLSEDAQTLDQLLRICYPTVDPVLDKTEDIEAVLVAAVKYQIEVAQVFYAKALMNPKILQCDPFSVYAITCRFLLKEQTHAAAKVTLYHHLPVRTTSHSFPNALKDLPATSLLDLIQYRDECKNAALSVLSDEGYWQLHADKFDHSYKYCEDCHFLMHDSLIRRFDLDLQQYRAFVHNALISTPCGRMKLDGDDILASRIWRIHGDIVGCISCHKSMILKLKGIDSAVNAEVERRIADVELHLGF